MRKYTLKYNLDLTFLSDLKPPRSDAGEHPHRGQVVQEAGGVMRLPDRGLRRAPGRAERPRARQQTRPGQRQDGHPPVIRGHGSVLVITIIIIIINPR